MHSRKVMKLALVVVVQYLFYSYVVNNSTIFNDGWPLRNILLGFIIWCILTALSSIILTKKFRSTIVFSMILLSSGIVLIPVLKYSNELYLYNNWDSLAHYNFGNYILNHGSIPDTGLVYSVAYRLHPANGVIPAVLAMILPTSQLGLPMVIYMISSNTVYLTTIMLYVARKILDKNLTRLCVIACLSAFSFLYFYTFYCGSAISYGLIGLMIYMILSSMERSSHHVRDLITSLLLFIGLWATHLSSASLMIVFIILSLIFKRFLDKGKQNLQFLYTLTILLTLIFLFLQIIVDLIITKDILITINNTLRSLTSREIYIYRESQISLLDAVRAVLSIHSKHSIILLMSIVLISSTIFSSIIVKKTSKSSLIFSDHGNLESMEILPWILASIALWIVGYIATQELVQGFRATTFIQWFLIVLLIDYINKLSKKVDTHAYSFATKKILSSIFLVAVILANTLANYGIPQFAPIIRYEDGLVGISTASPVNDITLSTYWYINELITPEIKIIGIEPYTTFALLDTLQTQNKLLITKTILDSKEAINIINKIIEEYNNIIIPMPSTYRLGHAKYLYESFYTLPNDYLRQFSSIIYNNGGLLIYYPIENKAK